MSLNVTPGAGHDLHHYQALSTSVVSEYFRYHLILVMRSLSVYSSYMGKLWDQKCTLTKRDRAQMSTSLYTLRSARFSQQVDILSCLYQGRVTALRPSINDRYIVFSQEGGITASTTQEIVGFLIPGCGMGMYLGINLLPSDGSKGSSLPRTLIHPLPLHYCP